MQRHIIIMQYQINNNIILIYWDTSLVFYGFFKT